MITAHGIIVSTGSGGPVRPESVTTRVGSAPAAPYSEPYSGQRRRRSQIPFPSPSGGPQGPGPASARTTAAPSVDGFNAALAARSKYRPHARAALRTHGGRDCEPTHGGPGRDGGDGHRSRRPCRHWRRRRRRGGGLAVSQPTMPQEDAAAAGAGWRWPPGPSMQCRAGSVSGQRWPPPQSARRGLPPPLRRRPRPAQRPPPPAQSESADSAPRGPLPAKDAGRTRGPIIRTRTRTGCTRDP